MHPNSRASVVRLVAINAGVGVVIGLVFAAAVLAFDYQGIWSLVRKTDAAVPALALLFGGFAVTFGSVVSGSAIMALGNRMAEEEGGPGRRGQTIRLSPVREMAAGAGTTIGGRR
jgi:hypothetical protein